MTTFIELSHNIALILSLTFIYGFIAPYAERLSRQTQLVLRGLLFGVFAMISMITPIQIQPGLFYDAHTIVICIAGIYGGAVPAIISAVLIGVLRILIGGIGTSSAVVSIAAAAAVGIALYRYHQRRGEQPSSGLLILAGLALAAVEMILDAVLTGLGASIIETTFPTTVVLYPVGMLLLGALLSQQQRERDTQRALRESEQRFRALFNSASLQLSLLKPDGTVLETNRTALDFGGLQPVDVVGRPIWETYWWEISPETQVKLKDAVQRAAQGELVRYEAAVWGAEKRAMTIDFTLEPLKDELGNVALLIAAGRDIDAQKTLEQQQVDLMLERERSRLLKKFISDVSHDLRTPLAVIRLNLELLRRTMETPQQRQRIDTLASQEHHLTRVLTDMMIMLSVEEPSTFQLKPLDLKFVAQIVIDQLHSTALNKQQTLVFNHPDDPLPIQADQVEMERALNKLLINALTYTPNGGTVTLSLLREVDDAVIEIQDTGIGIAPNDLPNIFQRFYRADRGRSMDTGGVGLGLSITRRIIEAHNGRIEVESTPDVGTIFHVFLPLTLPETDVSTSNALYG